MKKSNANRSSITGSSVNSPTVSILFTGDIGLTSACYDSSELFSDELIKHFTSSGAVCINLELPFTGEDYKMAPYTHPSLKSLPKSSVFLSVLRPTVINICTNHCMDGKKEGIELTKKIIRDLKACPMGTGVNEKDAREPCSIQIGCFQFRFLSYCKKGSYTASKNRAGAALLSEENLREDIPKAIEDCDFLIVSLHMGNEFSKSVHPMYRELAQLCVELGASCVIGHHPHVIQGIENYKGKPIFYSLGNFLFDNYAGAVTYKGHWEDRHKGILVKVSFSSDGISYEIIPTIYTSKPLCSRIADEEEARSIISEVDNLSTLVLSGEDTISTEAEAIRAIAKREFATICVLTRIHGFRFVLHFIKSLKIRHFKMLFSSFRRMVFRR